MKVCKHESKAYKNHILADPMYIFSENGSLTSAGPSGETTKSILENHTPYSISKYIFKVNNSGTRTRCGICSKL